MSDTVPMIGGPADGRTVPRSFAARDGDTLRPAIEWAEPPADPFRLVERALYVHRRAHRAAPHPCRRGAQLFAGWDLYVASSLTDRDVPLDLGVPPVRFRVDPTTPPVPGAGDAGWSQ